MCGMVQGYFCLLECDWIEEAASSGLLMSGLLSSMPSSLSIDDPEEDLVDES